jgi:hypothetical protein
LPNLIWELIRSLPNLNIEKCKSLLMQKILSFGKVKPFMCQRHHREMFVECLTITEFSRCSTPEYPAFILRCAAPFGVVWLCGSTNISGALHLAGFFS